uniref:Vacuolar iron transporter n=1 Tax=Chenopodium quinoa TaxID=63459 RepID=A0A803LHV9_CHEQI
MEPGQTVHRNTVELETIRANSVYEDNNQGQKRADKGENDDLDYTKRAQWLRAAVLGANDGLITTASLMMGVGAVKQDVKAMILTGFAGLVAAACSMAIGDPIQAAFASALAVAVGAVVPLLAALSVKNHKVRLGVVPAAVTVALVVFGWLGAYLGKAPILRASLRVLLGGWFAMGITFGLTKLIGSHGL